MAKRKYNRRRKKSFTIPIAVVGGMMPASYYIVDGASKYGIKNIPARLSIATTGYNPETGRWGMGYLVKFMGPVLLGAGIHKVAGKLGINRALGRAGLPWIRI